MERNWRTFTRERRTKSWRTRRFNIRRASSPHFAPRAKGAKPWRIFSHRVLTRCTSMTRPSGFWMRSLAFGAIGGRKAYPGDWYARNMYIEGTPQYEYHLRHYGHPSKFGYKDLCALWKAERFDPEGLMDLYVKAGARYFMSQGTHHDHFFNYAWVKIHPPVL